VSSYIHNFIFIFVAEITAEQHFNVYSGGGLHNRNGYKTRDQKKRTKNYSPKKEVSVCFLNACAIENYMESQLICECFV